MPGRILRTADFLFLVTKSGAEATDLSAQISQFSFLSSSSRPCLEFGTPHISGSGRTLARGLIVRTPGREPGGGECGGGEGDGGEGGGSMGGGGKGEAMVVGEMRGERERGGGGGEGGGGEGGGDGGGGDGGGSVGT